jgi:hypothetical protein
MRADRVENTASNSSSMVAFFFSNNSSTVASAFVASEKCLQSRYLAMTFFSFFTNPAFSRHVTILIFEELLLLGYVG